MLNAVFPVMNAVDAWLAYGLPLVVRVSLWGVVAGIAAMGIYAAASNQQAIPTLKDKSRDLRRKMLDPSLEEYSEFVALAKETFKVTFGLLGKVMGPVFLAALPVLVIASWLDTFHGYSLPDKSQPVSITLVPVHSEFNIEPREVLPDKMDGKIKMLAPAKLSDPVSFYVNDQMVYQGNVFALPAPVIAKKTWLNFFLANEAGYLQQDSPVDEIHIHFPPKPIHNGLPDWAAGWEWTFFISIFLVSLPVKLIFKIH